MSKLLDTYELRTGITGAWAHEIVAELLHRGKTAQRFSTAEPPTTWGAFGLSAVDRWIRQRSAKQKGAVLWHRFAPVDRFNPYFKISTVLPGEFPVRASVTRENHFIVPSQADAHLLQKHWGVESEQTFVVPPTPRIAVTSAPKQDPYPEGGVLFLHGSMRRGDVNHHVRVLSSFFPQWAVRSVELSNRTVFTVSNWVSLLRKTRICFYLENSPFDPGVAAIEAMQRGIPVIFSEGHRALTQWVSRKNFQLAWYLVERPSIEQLKTELEAEKARWEQEKVFAASPLETYLELYDTVEKRIELPPTEVPVSAGLTPIAALSRA